MCQRKMEKKECPVLFLNHSFLTVLDLVHSDVTVPYRAMGHYCFSSTYDYLHGPVGAMAQGPQTADLLLKC